MLQTSSGGNIVIVKVTTADDNSMAGQFQVNLVAQFLGSEYVCSTILDIERNASYDSLLSHVFADLLIEREETLSTATIASEAEVPTLFVMN